MDFGYSSLQWQREQMLSTKIIKRIQNHYKSQSNCRSSLRTYCDLCCAADTCCIKERSQNCKSKQSLSNEPCHGERKEIMSAICGSVENSSLLYARDFSKIPPLPQQHQNCSVLPTTSTPRCHCSWWVGQVTQLQSSGWPCT